MSAFKDHFSGHAALYRQARPHYPDALFAWLAEQAPALDHAWDCATGNGQAAIALARHFDLVTATDASAEQIAQAEPAQGIEYRTAPAEHSGLADASVDLITVAQAAHWFHWPAFVAEAKRVLRPGGVLAVWCYGLASIGPAVDAVVGAYYSGTLGAYWPPERRLVERGYRDLDLPFAAIAAPDFAMQADWDLAQLLAYLGSWSATRRLADQTGSDPLAALAPALEAAWGDARSRTVRWPLALRIGRT